jgi:hypothetical protein
MFKFSNSHIETFLDCRRKAFLQYWKDGTGYTPVTGVTEQAVGSLAHAMLASVLKGMELDEAVAKARLDWESTLTLALTNAGEFEVKRQMALAEGLVRAWCKVRLPKILEQFEVIGVERECEVPMGGDLVLMTRNDFDLRRKSDGALWAGEFKTTGTNSGSYFEGWRYATQSLTHVYAMKEKYGKVGEGVMFEFLYKGAKRKDSEGKDQYYSPLVKGYVKRGAPPFMQNEYAFEYTKSKGWEGCNSWEEMNLSQWIDLLPVEKLEEHLFNKEIYRNEGEWERWKRQAVAQMERVQGGLNDLAGGIDEDEVMDWVFPGNFNQSCFDDKYHHRCSYLDFDYGLVDDLEGSGRFQKRVPHHEKEFSA